MGILAYKILMTFDDLLRILVERKGSDLHIIAGLRPAIRIHGQPVPLAEMDRLTPAAAKELIYSVLSPHQRDCFENDPEFRNELDFGYGLPGVGRFRFNVHLQRGTVAASVRALADRIPALKDLGLPESVGEFIKAKRGLVLVTGPTGSGKSTTLAGMIDAVN